MSQEVVHQRLRRWVTSVRGPDHGEPTGPAFSALLADVLGVSPRQDVTEQWIRIEADVPHALSESERLTVLRFLLAQAVPFGRRLHRDGTSTIWAEADARRRDEP
ncbi:hypothetical protein GCM10010277_84680 [Streptomyces longisporoflavus]|uniref:hypothetical protein n=1 Tax=Streptomyces longisporoflavus TaxID=28044 RepID=UPI00167D3CD1|nr:hypothetical protein [Streptomyces longisporoflavus]GGV72141.1 hypothetical protein GCM10010277_84680 [Streptomyces longisporoflavus]